MAKYSQYSIFSQILSSLIRLLMSSTATLNVPDPAERKYKKESAGLSLSASAWLSFSIGLALLLAVLAFSLVAVR